MLDFFQRIFGSSTNSVPVKTSNIEYDPAPHCRGSHGPFVDDNYKELFNNHSIDELRAIHKENPICTDCNNVAELVSITQDLTLKPVDADINKFIFLTEDLGIKTNTDAALDIAIETGNMTFTQYLISKGCKYSKYAKQMAFVNKNFSTGLYADSYGQERNNISIKTVHHKITKTGQQWSDEIPTNCYY